MSGSHPGYGRDGKRLENVETMTEASMRQELVTDAVNHYTGGGDMLNRKRLLARQVRMYVRIGELSGAGAEAAINDVLDEVHTLTGVRGLPVA